MRRSEPYFKMAMPKISHLTYVLSSTATSQCTNVALTYFHINICLEIQAATQVLKHKTCTVSYTNNSQFWGAESKCKRKMIFSETPCLERNESFLFQQWIAQHITHSAGVGGTLNTGKEYLFLAWNREGAILILLNACTKDANVTRLHLIPSENIGCSSVKTYSSEVPPPRELCIVLLWSMTTWKMQEMSRYTVNHLTYSPNGCCWATCWIWIWLRRAISCKY